MGRSLADNVLRTIGEGKSIPEQKRIEKWLRDNIVNDLWKLGVRREAESREKSRVALKAKALFVV